MTRSPAVPKLTYTKVIGRRTSWNKPLYRISPGFELLGIQVPDEFETDRISAPRPVMWMLPKRHIDPAAVLHDYCRRHRHDMELWETDLVFLQAMYLCGVPEPWRTICWLAVRTNRSRG